MNKNYKIIPEIEDCLLQEKKVKEILQQGNIEERIALCKLSRILQKQKEQQYQGPAILDRCELDLAVHCGYLAEQYEIKLQRWKTMDKEIGVMEKPDLILFFEFYEKGGEDDPRKELVKQRKQVYLELQEQLYNMWIEYCDENKTHLVFVPAKKEMYKKISLVQDIIKQKPADRIVFTGACHSGKTITANNL